jgi:arabinose-5-phosphate isomerase
MGTHAAQPEVEHAREILSLQADAIRRTAAALDQRFADAVEVLVTCARRDGTVLVTGLGKSGLVGSKISATLASLGIPSHAVHPSEAAHGDLGRFRARDAVIAISASGETEEVVALCALLRQDGLPIISITSPRPHDAREHSSLERLATVPLRLDIGIEAGSPEFIAPTSSTTTTLALGDALALAAARRMSFTHADFARRHPGGSLGDLLRPVTDVLRFVTGRNMPVIEDTHTVERALLDASTVARRPGALVLIDRHTRAISGLFTDADLRRLILRDTAELKRPICDVMTRNPRTLPSSARVVDAVKLIRELRTDEIPIVDEAGHPVGILDVQDLVAMRLVKDEPGS